jgi:hypothetical protein
MTYHTKYTLLAKTNFFLPQIICLDTVHADNTSHRSLAYDMLVTAKQIQDGSEQNAQLLLKSLYIILCFPAFQTLGEQTHLRKCITACSEGNVVLTPGKLDVLISDM